MSAAPVLTAKHETLEWVERYQRRGWRVVPVERKGECKGPTVPEWETMKSGAALAQFRANPNRNIALVTGPASGVFVLDVDSKPDENKDGFAALEALEELYGRLPNTLQSVTGSGGRHYFFRWPGFHVAGSAGKLNPGLDVRGWHGAIVLPPSIHKSGGSYIWDGAREFEDEPILDAPEWLLELLKPKRFSAQGELSTALWKCYHKGAYRNQTWFDAAAQLRDNGIDQDEAKRVAVMFVKEAPPGDHPYTRDEALASVASAYSRSPREPWGNAPSADPGDERRVIVPGPFTDAGNAERLVSKHGADIRYCHPQSAWYTWTGAAWATDDSGRLMAMAKDIARGLYAEASQIEDDSQRKACVSWARKSESTNSRRAMIVAAQSERGVPASPGEFDARPMLLNVKNGTLDLETGQLREHRRADMLTKVCPVTYDPLARSEAWERFLTGCTGGDADLAGFLQRAAGYSLTGSTAEEKLFFVHGPGAAGKSTYLEAIKATLGPYSKTADFETFLARSFTGGGPRNDVAALAGARFVLSVEVDEGKRLAEGLVKMLTGGDAITARHLYQEGFEFHPEFKLWLAANHKPTVRDDDTAMWRRILVIPFEQVVPVEKRDPSLKAELRDPERTGAAILAWAVRGCLEWQRNGLGVPPIVERATRGYRSEMDPIAGFVEEWIVPDADGWESSAAIAAAYETWARAEGIPDKERLKPRAVGNRLAELHGFARQRRGTLRERGHSGLRLRSF